MGFVVFLAIAAVLLCALAVGAVLHAVHHPPRKTYAAALGRGDPTELEEAGLTGSTANFTLSDGAKSPAFLVRGADPAGPVVVVLHGFGDSRFGALTWAPLLVPYCSDLVLFDQRGQGEATAPRATLATREVDDVFAVLDQLGLARGEVEEEATDEGATAGGAASGAARDRPVVLFGYSVGAATAIGAAAAQPQRIAGVIGDGAYRFWHEPVRGTLRRRRYPTEPVMALSRLVMWLVNRRLRQFDRAVLARELHCPLLLLHGDSDAYCPLASAQAIADATPQGELVVFAGGGHLDLAAIDPAGYRDALSRYFAQLKRSASEQSA